MQVTVPSERKYEIYHAALSEKLSHEQVAKRFRLTPRQVQRILVEVATFVAEYGSEGLLNVRPERMELEALHVCYERLSHFYKTVMRQWTKLGETEPASSGRIRLLQAAARLSIDQTKLAGRIAKVQLEMIEAGTLQHKTHQFVYETDAEEFKEPEIANSPPVGGCTVNEAEPTPAQVQAMEAAFLKLGPNAGLDEVYAFMNEQGLLQAFENTPVQ